MQNILEKLYSEILSENISEDEQFEAYHNLLGFYWEIIKKEDKFRCK